MGFMLIDFIAQNGEFHKKRQSHIQKQEMAGQKILLVKPQTFMNLSGQAVKEIMSFYKISLENLLVIHDDKDQIFGKIKFQKLRGDGGHRGIKSIHQELRSQDYCRLKMGVASSPVSQTEKERAKKISPPSGTQPIIDFAGIAGRGEDIKPKWDTSRFVLSPFSQREKQKLPDFLERGRKAVYCFVQNGYETSASQFNNTGLKG